MIPVENLYAKLTSRNIPRANCAGIDTDVFTELHHFKDAQRICSRCDSSTQCFSLAIENQEIGTWGGVWFGYWLVREARGSTKGQNRNIAPTSRRTVELHASRMCRAMGIGMDEYVERFGSPSSVRSFKKALAALRTRQVA